MARYQKALQTPGPAEYYASAIGQYMMNEGFSLIDYKGYKVWKKGIGLATAPQFFSIQYKDSTVYLEAFIRYPLLPGVYVGEMGITGFFAALPKSLLKDRVLTVESYIAGLWQQQAGQPPVQQPPQDPQS